MALPVVLKEPEVKAPAGPTAEDMLAREREERRQLEQRFVAAEADARARFDMLDRRQAPTMSAAQAQQELGLTAEDIAANPDKALAMLEEHITQKTEARLEKKYGGQLNALSSRAFSSDVEALKGKKYAADVVPLVDEYCRANPQEMNTPGKATEVYERIVGKNIEELQRRDASRGGSMEKNYTSSARTEEPPLRQAGSLRVDAAEDTDADGALTEAEEATRLSYNAYGANISKKEWAAIAGGKIYPKNRASDWQPEAIAKGAALPRMRKVTNAE